MTWSLGIDFGTSYTVAATAKDGAVATIDVESNGSNRIPSSVFVGEDGQILVGTAAQHQAVFAPERYEPTPKRSLGEGELFLGDDLVPVADLAAAILRRVYTEACRQQGERAPSELRLTHPADWSEKRVSVLREAAERAGLPRAIFVAEPVAAAVRIALQRTEPGQHIAVYDFGGGTFDAAVLQRTAAGFEVAGPPAGRDPLGGEDIDRRIIGYLGKLLADDHAEAWAKLLNPPDVEWRRDAAALRAEVQRAKETLSEVTACQLWVPGVKRDVQLTRAELEELIGADVEATIDTLETALRDAGVEPAALAGLYLVGGSSRIPLVADMLWRRLGVRPAVQDNPKSVVAMGAAGWAASVPRAAAVAASAPDGSAARFRPQLAMSFDPVVWPSGSRWLAQLTVDHVESPPLTLRARDEAAPGLDSAGLAARAGEVRARTPGYLEQALISARVLGAGEGYERRFSAQIGGMAVPMFEQYLVLGGRALVVACPEAARFLVESLTLAAGPELQTRFELEVPPGWSVAESLILGGPSQGGRRGVSGERVVFPPGGHARAWVQAKLGELQRVPGARPAGEPIPAQILGRLDGHIYTVVHEEKGTAMLTRLGVAAEEGLGLGMSVTVPTREQDMFGPLARHPRLTA